MKAPHRPGAIPGLSLRQPWARLVVAGLKTTENRVWQTSHRGPLLIHQSQRYDTDSGLTLATLPPVPDALLDPGPPGWIGLVDVTDCHTGPDNDELSEVLTGLRFGCAGVPDGPRCPWGNVGQFHWTLGNARQFTRTLPGPGRLGLFRPPGHVLDQARMTLLINERQR